MEAVEIFPSMSGYRKDDTKEVVFTVNYAETYANIRAEVKKEVSEKKGLKPSNVSDEVWLGTIENEIEDEMELRRFKYVIPVSEIESAFVFDPDIYVKHFQSSNASPPEDTRVTFPAENANVITVE